MKPDKVKVANSRRRKSVVFPWKKDIEEFRRCQPTGPAQVPDCRHAGKKLECSSISLEDARRFHKRFYQTRDRWVQDSFILRHCEAASTGSRRRAISAAYFMSSERGRLRVCRKAFTRMLGIRTYRIDRVLRLCKEDMAAERKREAAALRAKKKFTTKKVTFATENEYRHFDVSAATPTTAELDSISSSDDVFNNTFNVTTNKFAESDLSGVTENISQQDNTVSFDESTKNSDYKPQLIVNPNCSMVKTDKKKSESSVSLDSISKIITFKSKGSDVTHFGRFKIYRSEQQLPKEVKLFQNNIKGLGPNETDNINDRSINSSGDGESRCPEREIQRHCRPNSIRAKGNELLDINEPSESGEQLTEGISAAQDAGEASRDTTSALEDTSMSLDVSVEKNFTSLSHYVASQKHETLEIVEQMKRLNVKGSNNNGGVEVGGQSCDDEENSAEHSRSETNPGNHKTAGIVVTLLEPCKSLSEEVEKQFRGLPHDWLGFKQGIQRSGATATPRRDCSAEGAAPAKHSTSEDAASKPPGNVNIYVEHQLESSRENPFAHVIESDTKLKLSLKDKCLRKGGLSVLQYNVNSDMNRQIVKNDKTPTRAQNGPMCQDKENICLPEDHPSRLAKGLPAGKETNKYKMTPGKVKRRLGKRNLTNDSLSSCRPKLVL